MGRVKDCLLSLFRRDGSASAGSSTIDGHRIRRPSFGRNLGAGRHRSEMSQCAAFSLPLPYSDYEAFNSASRQYLNTGAAHIFKTFPSEALVPLEDEGIGRLKALYEAWFPKNGSVSRDRVSGLYALSFVNSSCCEGTVTCGSASVTRSTRKHYIQCLYSGAGVRRGCGIVGDSPSTGIELWIKGSLPITGPWIQTLYVPPDERLNKLCMIAGPKSDFMACVNKGHSLIEMPMLTAGSDRSVFELDSDVYIYICRLSPCSSVTYTAASAARSMSEPPMYEFPRINRAVTISTTAPGSETIARSRRRNRSPRPGKTRSVFIHAYTDFAKNGRARSGGARLMLPGSVQLTSGDAIHLKNVTPASDISIKSTGFDRAQFILIDMPGYQDDADDARSV
ncbi:hypothetical protein H4S02_000597 [Coemansia sp. RSA 2611]|nr:hypothetical protein IWW52_003090 [Coemansia sp. RSA 2704]KAJ2326905.1 hypothetical protein IWW51_002037 [Coemansia sp. RSA 2702]KAJ2392776.1 hypothetical protein H4S02_000597 [Coemansia sp. RSA 2611]KAJ2717886.1 hypothetical protein H4R23_005169 [Coemansia sp. Cherry 401B]